MKHTYIINRDYETEIEFSKVERTSSVWEKVWEMETDTTNLLASPLKQTRFLGRT
jgi:hypothetical protein